MPKPALVKLGGSLLTNKAKDHTFQRGVAARLLQETARSEVPTILLHGAGSFAHPAVMRTGLGSGPMDAKRRAAVSEVFAGLADLESHVLAAAEAAGLRPVPVPLHITVRSDGEGLEGIPIDDIRTLSEEGHTPILHGTLIRSPRVGWAVLSADRILAELAGEVSPRVCVWATDVDGVYDGDPNDPGSRLVARLAPDADVTDAGGEGADATGRMAGKAEMARLAARHAPTIILNGTVRSRLLDALRGKAVPGTRVVA